MNFQNSKLKRELGIFDLTVFGIAAIVGAGIFSTIGLAASSGGPAVIFLFIFIGIACGFTALCYAEFASVIPASGSAYSYARHSFGELAGWILGWALIMEYGIGNIAIAVSWSNYLTSFIDACGFNIPEYIRMDYLSASKGYEQYHTLLLNHKEIPMYLQECYEAWTTAPMISGIRIIMDVPALFIISVISFILFLGTKESKIAGNVLVGIKIGIVLLVLIVGASYIHVENWKNFMPNGISGVMGGASAVFYAYIGFDAISTMAEESKNPKRDIPRAILFSLLICTILYILISLVLTGMVNYSELAVGDPLSFVFKKLNLRWLSGIIAFGAIIAMATVFLVFQMGLTRILMTMSRDKLLPAKFSEIHPRFLTPGFSTKMGAVLVIIPTFFMDLKMVVDLSCVGTLFAFASVCLGIIKIHNDPNAPQRNFRIIYINGKYILPALIVTGFLIMIIAFPSQWKIFWNLNDNLFEKLPTIIFMATLLLIALLSYKRNYSLIPALGVISCLYLITELGISNWIGFIVWLLIGLLIYRVSRYKKSESKSIR